MSCVLLARKHCALFSFAVFLPETVCVFTGLKYSGIIQSAREYVFRLYVSERPDHRIHCNANLRACLCALDSFPLEASSRSFGFIIIIHIM